jgi:hypothetical protein
LRRNPGGVGDDPEPGMIEDMGLTKDDLLQLTASYEATMAALRKRTISEGKFAWQLMTQERVRADDPTTCAADLGGYCSSSREEGTVGGTQTEAMYYAIGSSGKPPTPEPAPAFRNCSVFGCTCKGAADHYGIGFQGEGGGGSPFGCAPKGAQDWWIHRAEPCADPATSCCTAADYTQKDPPYAGCDANGQPVESLSLDLANFLLIRGPYAWLGHGWGGCAQPTADEGGGYPFPKLLHGDFGVPVDTLCKETVTPGVFERKFTKATVQMDCNTGAPSIVMHPPFEL